jgi:hypothetical protein
MSATTVFPNGKISSPTWKKTPDPLTPRVLLAVA